MTITKENFHTKKLGWKKFLVRLVKVFILINQSIRMFFLESIR